MRPIFFSLSILAAVAASSPVCAEEGGEEAPPVAEVHLFDDLNADGNSDAVARSDSGESASEERDDADQAPLPDPVEEPQ